MHPGQGELIKDDCLRHQPSPCGLLLVVMMNDCCESHESHLSTFHRKTGMDRLKKRRLKRLSTKRKNVMHLMSSELMDDIIAPPVLFSEVAV